MKKGDLAGVRVVKYKGLLGSDANFIAMQSIAPEGRAKGTMNLDSDPKTPPEEAIVLLAHGSHENFYRGLKR